MNDLKYRDATLEDMEQYFCWANDELVRQQSFSSEKVSPEIHQRWFLEHINDPGTMMLIFVKDEDHVGQVRVERSRNRFYIGISIDANWRGQKLSTLMLTMACREFFRRKMGSKIFAEIKLENKASIKTFRSANFGLFEECSDRYVYILEQ